MNRSMRSVLGAGRRERRLGVRSVVEALESRVMLAGSPWTGATPAGMAWHAGTVVGVDDPVFKFGSGLGLDGQFAYDAGRYKSMGLVEIGARTAAGFVPLLSVQDAWYDRSRVQHAGGEVARLWSDGGSLGSVHLMNGGFSLGFDALSAGDVSSVGGGASFAGAVLETSAISFAGGQVLLGGRLTLPGSVGGAVIQMSPGSVAAAGDGAVTFS